MHICDDEVKQISPPIKSSPTVLCFLGVDLKLPSHDLSLTAVTMRELGAGWEYKQLNLCTGT